ncbi:MAG: lipocalin family protein [Candidatus Bipolaricaulota bacterium]
MMRVVAGLLGIIVIAAVGFLPDGKPGPTSITSLDVERYMGLWYAVASIPTTFERMCVGGTTAHYRLLANGQIEVTNTCLTADGTKSRVVGRAWVGDPKRPAELKVSFVGVLGLWLFPGDYWILDLDAEYRYAVVGHPKLRYGWILSRTPTLADDTLDGIYDRLEEQGYSRTLFVPIDQTANLSRRLAPGN